MADIRLSIRLDLTDSDSIGPGKIALLEAIRVHGSISAAARYLGMSYRRAWLLVEQINKSLSQPAVTAATGAPRKLGSANFLNQQRLAQSCVANEVIGRISLRWKMSVLFSIDSGARTFAALKRTHPNLSDHILAARLRELRREGLIDKDERARRHPVYTATERGESLLKIMAALCAWGEGGLQQKHPRT